MTAKERVLRSIRHERVDRTPCFYLGLSTVNARLAMRLGIDAGNHEALLERLGVDVRFIGPELVPVADEDRYAYQFGAVHARLHNHPGSDEPGEFPVGDARTVGDLDQWRWPDPDWFDYAIPPDLAAAWQDSP